MSDEQSDVVKRARLDIEISTAGPSQMQHSVVADSLTSPILKLDADCLEELFEWLSLAELRALRQTCKRLKRVVDYFIKMNYPAVKIGYGCIKIYPNDFNKIKELDPVRMKMIKKLFFISLNNHLTEEKVVELKGILPQLEKLKFYRVVIHTNFYESILKWCSNLKYLSIRRTDFFAENPDEDHYWLKQKIPTIEHLRIHDIYVGEAIVPRELGTFLQLNPNIQTFSTDFKCLRLFNNTFSESNIKIDRLNICIETDYDVNEIRNTLDRLHDRGFHKRLHLFTWLGRDQASLDRIALMRGLEKVFFYLTGLNAAVTLPLMPQLRELCFQNDTQLGNFDIVSMAKNLANVERIYFEWVRIINIIPFIRYAPKLKEIKIDDKYGKGVYFEYGIMDVSALNKERKRLNGALKVTIYVPEKVYLSTKFASKKIEFDLVILKHTEAVDLISDEFYSY